VREQLRIVVDCGVGLRSDLLLTELCNRSSCICSGRIGDPSVDARQEEEKLVGFLTSS
jgi:hypothetical protein